MKIDLISLFPDMVRASLSDSILKRAQEKGLLEVNYHQFRDYAQNKHRKVDDTPYGGGSGLVMYVEVIDKVLQTVAKENCAHVIYFSPRGAKLNQKRVIELSKLEHIVMICGHYEGIDQRAIDLYVDEELSIGDYVLTGGELPAAVTIDAISRHLDGVLGDADSLKEESFSDHLLEYPQYTKPFSYQGNEVPEILISGHHGKIAQWRYRESLKITFERRRDLFYAHIMEVLKRGDKTELKNLSQGIKEME